MKSKIKSLAAAVFFLGCIALLIMLPILGNRKTEEKVTIPVVDRREIKTDRLRVSYLEKGDPSRELLVLIHGNTSSSQFFLQNIEELSKSFHVIAPDLRGYGFTEKLPIDATGGPRIWSEDIRAFLKALDPGKKPHLAGWSLGGAVVMQYAIDYPGEVSSLTLINPVSPFGYSGTKGLGGIPNNEYFSGTGGGNANTRLADAIKNKVRDASNPSSPAAALRAYFGTGYKLPPEWQEVFVESMLQMEIGPDFYPGNSTTVPLWPYTAPGDRGIINAISPKYMNLAGLADINPKPPILWLRGGRDEIVSDDCPRDTGYLGKQGFISGWPGKDAYPPQPMVSQTRYVMDKYRSNGGYYEECLFESAGHSPHIEEAEEFDRKLREFIGR